MRERQSHSVNQMFESDFEVCPVLATWEDVGNVPISGTFLHGMHFRLCANPSNHVLMLTKRRSTAPPSMRVVER